MPGNHNSGNPHPSAMGKGHPRRGGKKKGWKSRKTLEKLEVLKLFEAGWPEKGKRRGLRSRVQRIGELLESPDHSVRLSMEKFLWEQQYGRARETVELQGEVGFGELVLAARQRARAPEPDPVN